jgi:ADP-heptose:LPS heptosyltransferase
MAETAVFHIEGGIGKHITSTAVVECYKKHNPDTKIIVSCAWPEIYLNNPYIERVYRLNSVPYFYRDFIYNKDVEIFAQEPYKQTSHITKKKHLIETWCSMIGVKHTNESPRLFFNFREHEIASKIINNPENKPVLIFQPFGGPGKEHQETPYSWMRDIHPDTAQTLVNILSNKYHVVHICYDFHPILYNCQRVDVYLQKKVLFSLLTQSNARLLIDSSLQHAAAALNLPSTVVWVATHPSIFGYNIHKNILPIITHELGTVDSYLYDYNFTGAIHECPYSYPHEIFDIEAIVNTL